MGGGRWSWWWRGLEGSPARSSSWSGSCTPPRRTRWRTRPEQENLRTRFHNFSFLEQENLVWWKWKSLSRLVSKYGVKLAENIFGKSLNKNSHKKLYKNKYKICITNTNDNATPVREWLRLLRRNRFFVVEHQLRLGFPGLALKKILTWITTKEMECNREKTNRMFLRNNQNPTLVRPLALERRFT